MSAGTMGLLVGMIVGGGAGLAMGLCIGEQVVQDYLLRAIKDLQPDDTLSVEQIREMIGEESR